VNLKSADTDVWKNDVTRRSIYNTDSQA